MALTLEEMRNKVLLVLKKDPSKPGAYSNARLDEAINEAIDFVTSKMMIAGEGFTNKIVFLDSVANQREIDLPLGVVLINQVHYKDGEAFIPLTPSEGRGQIVTSAGSEKGQTYPNTYAVIDNKLFFDPPFGSSETGKIRMEGTFFPDSLVDTTDLLPQSMSRSAEHFIKYNAASVISSWSRNYNPPWSSIEARWYMSLETEINKRNNGLKFVRSFEG